MNELIAVKSTEIAEIEPQGGGFSPDYFAKWIEYIDALPKTVQTYTRNIRHFANYLATNGITAPTRADILNYKASMQGAYKPTTICAYMAAVRVFFEFCENEGLYPNIAQRVKGAKIKNRGKYHKREALTAAQAGRVLELIDRSTENGKRDYAIMVLMLTTGLRTISIAKADVGDITNKGAATVLCYEGKGDEDKSAYVEIEPNAEAAIREYLAIRGKLPDNAPLFGSLDHRAVGARLTPTSISQICKKHLIAAGFNSDKYTAHSLRHTAATIMLDSGHAITEVQEILEHSNIATTMIYAHQRDRAKNKAVYSVGVAIFGH